MPKVRFADYVEEFTGTIGGFVFKRSPSGKIIVSKKRDMSNVVWSEAQLAQRERFAQASAYAKAVKENPKIWAKYERRAKKLNKRPRDLAVSDYFLGNDLLAKK